MVGRGHARTFARNDAQDKRIVERATVFEWARALTAIEDAHVDSIVAGPEGEFPDFTARLNGNSVVIELTELLHSPGILKRAAKKMLGFDNLQWTEAHFRERVQERLDAKGVKLSKRGEYADVLILHTDEPWLSPHMIEEWLNREGFPRRAEFGVVHLLRTYVPGYAEHWPLFNLYGSRE